MEVDKLLQGKIPGPETGIEIKKSACYLCGPNSNCGLDLYVKDGEIIKVEGGLWHQASRGTLCSKGAANRQFIYSPERLKTPLKRIGEKGSLDFVPITWEEAYSTIATKLNGYKQTAGPETVSFYCGYPMHMRPFTQRLARTFGSPNYCTESSVCAKAAEFAFRLVYGTLGVPDIAGTDCLLIWSGNPFHTNTQLAELILDKLESGMQMIVVDPRVTPGAARADIHLQVKPGTDGALALAMAHVIINENLYDQVFVSEYTTGFAEYRDYVQAFTPEKAAAITGVPAELIERAARIYATAKSAAILQSADAIVHHTNGVQNYRAVFMLSGLTGRFDAPGGDLPATKTYTNVSAPFPSLEKQYMEVPIKGRSVPRIGQKQAPIWCEMITEAQAIFLPEQILTQVPYPVKAVVAFGLNHRMWPDTNHMQAALEKLEFFVNTDLFMTDTCRFADIVLPACSSVERGEFLCYGSGYALHTTPAIQPLYESKSDIDIVFELAKRLDIGDDLLRQGYEANLNWILQPSGLTLEILLEHPEGMLAPVIPAQEYFKYRRQGFATPSGKMEFVSGVCARYAEIPGIDALPCYRPAKYSAEATPELAREYPFVVNTGSRLPMYLHSRMFRTAWTKQLSPNPTLDINPEDAENLGVIQGDAVRLATRHGSIQAVANITEIALKGSVFMYHNYKSADVNLLIEHDYVDPISGYPGFKSFLGKVEKMDT